jgi:hypothetical protein
MGVIRRHIIFVDLVIFTPSSSIHVFEQNAQQEHFGPFPGKLLLTILTLTMVK